MFDLILRWVNNTSSPLPAEELVLLLYNISKKIICKELVCYQYVSAFQADSNIRYTPNKEKPVRKIISEHANRNIIINTVAKIYKYIDYGMDKSRHKFV